MSSPVEPSEPSTRNDTNSPLPDPKVRATLPAKEVFKLLGIDRTTGYKAIREGTFPLPVLRVNRLMLVPTAAIIKLLDPDSAVSTESAA